MQSTATQEYKTLTLDEATKVLNPKRISNNSTSCWLTPFVQQIVGATKSKNYVSLNNREFSLTQIGNTDRWLITPIEGFVPMAVFSLQSMKAHLKYGTAP